MADDDGRYRGPTMGRLPPITTLAAEINARRADRKHSVGDAARFLLDHKTELLQYESIEELAVAADSDSPPKYAKALVHKMLQVRAELARELWSRG